MVEGAPVSGELLLGHQHTIRIRIDPVAGAHCDASNLHVHIALADAVTALRRGAGMTQRELAKAVRREQSCSAGSRRGNVGWT